MHTHQHTVHPYYIMHPGHCISLISSYGVWLPCSLFQYHSKCDVTKPIKMLYLPRSGRMPRAKYGDSFIRKIKNLSALRVLLKNAFLAMPFFRSRCCCIAWNFHSLLNRVVSESRVRSSGNYSIKINWNLERNTILSWRFSKKTFVSRMRELNSTFFRTMKSRNTLINS